MKEIYKTNSNYTIQNVSGIFVVIPISKDCPAFNGMMKLEGIGPFLWNFFSKEETIENACKKVVEKYDVSFEKAYEDISKFVDSLLENDLMKKITS
jgi:hypothetical protein